MIDTYQTLSQLSEGIYKEKGSKFLSFAIPVESVEEVKETLVQYQKRFFDARHVCYAYQLGAEGKIFRANDNAEPSGTAGRPILGQIRSAELTDLLVIVVRYFGGTLLGTSGLITAYKTASADAIANGTVIQKLIQQNFRFHIQYPFLNDVMRIIKEEEPEVTKQVFDNDCFFHLKIRTSLAQKLQERLDKIESLRWVEDQI